MFNRIKDSQIKKQVQARWVEPLSYEKDIKRKRIIHICAYRSNKQMRLDAIGINKAIGYNKCGSEVSYDYVIGFRAIAITENGAVTVYEQMDLDISEKEQIVKLDNSITCKGCIIELRKSYVDGYHPSYQLCEGAFSLFGKVDCQKEHPKYNFLSCDSDKISHVVESDYIKAVFNTSAPRIEYLAFDSDGRGQFSENVISSQPALKLAHSNLLDECVNGPLHNSWNGDSIGFFQGEFEGESNIVENGIEYIVKLDAMEMKLMIKIEGKKIVFDLNQNVYDNCYVIDSCAFQMVFDTFRCVPNLLGENIKKGRSGLLKASYITFANIVDIKVNVLEGKGLWRFDSIRPLNIIDFQMIAAPINIKGGVGVLEKGEYYEKCTWEIFDYDSKMKNLAPASIADVVDKYTLSSLTYRADTGVYSNNPNSIHAFICLEHFDYLTRNVKGEAALLAMTFLKETLERSLDGAPSYGSGKMLKDGNLIQMEDAYIMTGISELKAVAKYMLLDAKEEWLIEYLPVFMDKLNLLYKRDTDNDGIVESEIRIGNSGDSQWSTNWYDVISFGYKDAFSNAILYGLLEDLVKLIDKRNIDFNIDICLWKKKLLESYHKEFFNKETGWYAGWKSKDGELHDYGFLFVNGCAINNGLVNEKLAKKITKKMFGLLIKSDIEAFCYGLPGNLMDIDDKDMAEIMHQKPYGFYENGAYTMSQAHRFIDAMYKTGLSEEADWLMKKMAKGFANKEVISYIGSGVDWRFQNGVPSGYEGILCDQFGMIATMLKRYNKDE